MKPPSRRVGYGYHDGSGNTTRPESMTFPDGDILGYGYAGEAADKLSRINQIALDGGQLCEYDYLGMSTAVTTRYFDLDGVNPALVAGDNYYTYDDLYQVTSRKQGDLTGTFPDYTGIQSPAAQEESFGFDETGNCRFGDLLYGFASWDPLNAAKQWLKNDNAGMGDPDPLDQARQHNAANEITSIANTNPTEAVTQAVYDPAGNMTTLPKPGDWTEGYDVTWDGWNRIVSIKDTGTSNVVARYAYDGLTRRTTADSGESTDVRHYYYNRQWRCVEEYLNSEADAERRYAWSPRSRWQMILRQRSDTGTLDENLYTLYDAMDPVAVVDESGAVKERYAYSAFGETTILNSDFTVRSTGSAYDWNLLFHVEFRDGTGLYNYGYRYYHPELGRWLSRDPLKELSGNNLYRFVSNNPVGARDVIGLADPPFDPSVPEIENDNTLDGISFAEIAAIVMDGNEISPGVTRNIVTSFDAYDLGWGVSDFFDVCKHIAASTKGRATEDMSEVIDGGVEFFNADNMRTTAGPGRISPQINGELSWEPYPCGDEVYTWSFEGEITIAPNYQDFNPDPTRGSGKDMIALLIEIGIPNKKTFFIRFKGGREVSESGCCDSRTQSPSETY